MCGEEKSFDNFSPTNRKPYYRGTCKDCRNKELRKGTISHTRFKKGNVPQWPFLNGHVPYMTGKNHSDKSREKISLKLKGRIKRPGLRTGIKAREWAKLVKERDNWTCQLCGKKEKLHAHHIVPWTKDEKLRYEIGNGITYCMSCHAKVEGFQDGHKLSKESIEKMRSSKRGSKIG
jgi:hypothetical protein